MNESILIVQDDFVTANDLQLILVKAGYNVCGVAISLHEAREILKKEKPSLALLDIHLQGELDGIELARELKEKNIGFIYLSAFSSQDILEAAKATEPYGFLVKPYRETDLLVTVDLARYRQAYGLESKIRRENYLHAQLTGIIHQHIEWEEKLLQIARTIQPFIPFDFIATLRKADGSSKGGVGFLRIGFDEFQPIKFDELLTVSGLRPDELRRIQEASSTLFNTNATWYNGRDFEHLCTLNPMKKLLADTFQLASNMVIPVLPVNGGLFIFSFFSRRSDAYSQDHLALLFRLQQLLTIALDSTLTNDMEIPPFHDPVTTVARGCKKDFLVFRYNKYVTVSTDTIAFFYLKYESCMMACFDRQEYSINYSLEQIQNILSELQFFRLNRQFLVNFNAVKEVEHYFSRRLLVKLVVPVSEKLLVSREKASSFFRWLENR